MRRRCKFFLQLFTAFRPIYFITCAYVLTLRSTTVYVEFVRILQSKIIIRIQIEELTSGTKRCHLIRPRSIGGFLFISRGGSSFAGTRWRHLANTVERPSRGGDGWVQPQGVAMWSVAFQPRRDE